ncbi:MAG: MFS transporter [Mycobacteriaceae bacterium]|nr:MFS transporter [Mycobacteriaceae bacterium]
MRKWLPLFATCLGTLMLLIDVTIVTVALPDIAADLGGGLSGLQWVMDGYALALAALLLVFGAVADRFGAKRTYLAGLAVFAGASLMCGMAGSISILVAARALQGIGGAAMLTTTLSLLHTTYSGRDRGIAFGVWGAVAGAAAGTGVVLGGVLTGTLSWPWIFLVNLPIAAVAISLSAVVFPASRQRRETSVDLPGMVAFALAATAVTFGVIRGGEHGWTDWRAVAALTTAAVCALAFVRIETGSAAPMFPPALLGNRTFGATVLGATGQTFAAFAATPLISLWLQQQLQLSPIRAGLAMLPLAATAFVVAGAFGRVLHSAAPRWTIGAGLVVIGTGALLTTLIDSGSTWTALIPGFVVIGVGVGVNAPVLAAVGMAAVPPHQAGTASGAINTARQLGMALGVAVLGTVFRSAAGDAVTAADVARGLDTAGVVAGSVGIGAGIVSFALLSRRTPARAAAPEPAVAA